jgi:hypothetical protein
MSGDPERSNHKHSPQVAATPDKPHAYAVTKYHVCSLQFLTRYAYCHATVKVFERSQGQLRSDLRSNLHICSAATEKYRSVLMNYTYC